MARSIALVIGGANCVFEDIANAKAVLAGYSVRSLYINNQIASFPEQGIAITLHPEKLGKWLQLRRSANLAAPLEIWSHRAHPLVTRHTNNQEWRGSSGLFASQAAGLFLGPATRVILCGVPMNTENKHYDCSRPWVAAHAFRDAWKQHKAELAPFVRSMSGWTAELLGLPDADWLSA